MNPPLFLSLVKPLFPFFFGLLAIGVLFVALTRGLGGRSPNLRKQKKSWLLTLAVWVLALFFLFYGGVVLYRAWHPAKFPVSHTRDSHPGG